MYNIYIIKYKYIFISADNFGILEKFLINVILKHYIISYILSNYFYENVYLF